MPDDTVSKASIAVTNDGDDLKLTSSERYLIRNFRAMKGSARSMLLDLSDEYKRTLPAVPTKLRLLRPTE